MSANVESSFGRRGEREMEKRINWRPLTFFCVFYFLFFSDLPAQISTVCVTRISEYPRASWIWIKPRPSQNHDIGASSPPHVTMWPYDCVCHYPPPDTIPTTVFWGFFLRRLLQSPRIRSDDEILKSAWGGGGVWDGGWGDNFLF